MGAVHTRLAFSLGFPVPFLEECFWGFAAGVFALPPRRLVRPPNFALHLVTGTHECTRPRMNKLLLPNAPVSTIPTAWYGILQPLMARPLSHSAVNSDARFLPPTHPCNWIIEGNLLLVLCSHSDNFTCTKSLLSLIADAYPHPFHQCLRCSRGGRMGTAP